MVCELNFLDSRTKKAPFKLCLICTPRKSLYTKFMAGEIFEKEQVSQPVSFVRPIVDLQEKNSFFYMPKDVPYAIKMCAFDIYVLNKHYYGSSF